MFYETASRFQTKVYNDGLLFSIRASNFEDSPIVDCKPQFLLFNFDNHFLDLGLFTEISSLAILFTPFKFTAEIASGFIVRNSTVFICMSYNAVQIVERL